MNKLIGYYRRFLHNIEYKDGYYKKILIILTTILLVDLIVLFIIW